MVNVLIMSVCHVYGHYGDGIYQSLSCSAHIISYATSQSFKEKKNGEKGIVKNQYVINHRSVTLSCSLCSHDALVKMLSINY